MPKGKSKKKSIKNKVSNKNIAPLSENDDRYLAKGRSKMVWLYKSNKTMNLLKEPHMNKVIVNAFNEQMLENEPLDLSKKRKEQENEFLFTDRMRIFFPELIPRVYPIRVSIEPPRFRYEKDRCYPLPRDEHLFSHMIEISDFILERGWVFLDMKFGNLGQINGDTYLLDTDPHSFYCIPRYLDPELNRRTEDFYKVSCHMIILSVCINFIPEVPLETLHRFTKKQNYSPALFRKIYYEPPPKVSDIAEFNNQIFLQEKHPEIQVDPEKIMDPRAFIRAYGAYKEMHALDRLNEILRYTL